MQLGHVGENRQPEEPVSEARSRGFRGTESHFRIPRFATDNFSRLNSLKVGVMGVKYLLGSRLVQGVGEQ